MNYYFITGASRGIGKAIAELLIQNKENYVFGLSRTNEIEHENFQYIECDLSDLDEVRSFDFPDFKDPYSIVLINNSATTSEIISFGKLESDEIIETYNINIVAPSLLMNGFLKKYQSYKCRRTIINISSGAAYKPIESWSTYCASKAALAMITEVIDIEQKLKFSDSPVHVFSVGPGVVDTQMQTKLRSVTPDNFSMVGKFIEYHEKKELANPGDVAKKIFEIIKTPERFEKVALSVKDI